MTYSKQDFKNAIEKKLRLQYECTPQEANDGEMFRACAMVLRDIMASRSVDSRQKVNREEKRQVHYLSMEFLMGRSLLKNAYNLGVIEPLSEALEEMGFRAGDLFEKEPDAGLGNGGLGRLAACYLESMTTLEIPATGYSICYELGIFKQKIDEGRQIELPDNWMDLGSAWLLPKQLEAETVHFGGSVRAQWDKGHFMVVPEDATSVLAVPCDMVIAGYDTEHMNTLRLWTARSPHPVDMQLFSKGQYLQAARDRAEAEAISQVLYPEDNHPEGKALRLKQQYFFVSASLQSITRKHIEVYGTLKNFHQKNVIQINDTHPTLVIPEMMRILMDDAGMDWDEAWEITHNAVAYTNHTVLAEALEVWPQNLLETLLPRVWQIIQEISRRWEERVDAFYHDREKTKKMAIIWDGRVHMANLCIAGGMAVNGVSALHSDILRNDVFRDACGMEPEKFKNVTNGVDHRRWISQCNPALDRLIRDLVGDGYLTHAEKLAGLETYADDATVQRRLAEIKTANKIAFARWAKAQQGVMLNTDGIFNVQVKRLHEYKRQLLNVLQIITLYQQLQDDPGRDMVPQTFLFGAKAAPGYAVAKRIIQLINSLAKQIEGDSICRDKLQVCFLENYRVTMAEKLMPASEISQQISTAGKEASGTGNMKFMMNGALTVGTLDGANVEMHQVLGDEHMFLFGLHSDEVAALRGQYVPRMYYERDPMLRRAVDMLKGTFSDGNSYEDLWHLLVDRDEYFLLADYASYVDAQRRAVAYYKDPGAWNRSSLINIARSGIFASDRSIADYADTIWHVPYKK